MNSVMVVGYHAVPQLFLKDIAQPVHKRGKEKTEFPK